VFSFVGKRKRIDVAKTADASRSTNGTGCSHMIRTTIVRVYSWTGSSFPLVVYVDAILSTAASSPHLIEIDKL